MKVVVTQANEDHEYRPTSADNKRLFIEGETESILPYCQYIMGPDGSKALLTNDIRNEISNFEKTERRFNNFTMGVAYQDLNDIQAARATQDDRRDIVEKKAMVLLGVFSFKPKPKPDIEFNLDRFSKAGIKIKIVTSENKEAAFDLLKCCGLISEGNLASYPGAIVEGHELRELTGGIMCKRCSKKPTDCVCNYDADYELVARQVLEPELERKIANISVLANANPEDKKLLVLMLRNIGETVAVTGDCNYDIPAMKSADVSFTNH